jgi:tetratricopeptide (TPR) repeat protein
MKLPPSRLLTRLDTEIAAERDPLRADLLRAERAAYLIRQGQSDLATSELAALHQKYDGRPNVEMSAWLSLADGLASYFSDMGPAAVDKLRRSRALSEAAGLSTLHAISAAWLSQVDYLRLDLPAMASHLDQAFRQAGDTNYAALARATLVVAQGFHTAQRLDLALPWYERCRRNAIEEGDDATLSALMHNMASIRAGNMRRAELLGSGDRGEGEHALMAAESTWAFDRLVGASSLDSYVPLLHAQILTVQGKYQYALELYEKHLLSGLAQGLERLHGTFLADQAWCRVNLQQLELARQDAAEAQRHLDMSGGSEDRAPGFARLAKVFALFGEAEASAKNERLAALMWEGQAKLCESLVAALAPIAERYRTSDS